ncbi:MAG: exodeoxyribonuclease III [Bdellovibrionales bacterium]|jgi:exodeoxyribonuclease-3|nr:exodeoxyribonuclease III [Bdellovibrionales bacterium]
MKIITWNVNGIRAVGKKGFVPFVERENPDILCLQETKAHFDQVEPNIRVPAGFQGTWSSAIRKGYSGVATFLNPKCTAPPVSIEPSVGIQAYDDEGRVVVSDHGPFLLYNIYFPNGGSGDERHRFKQKFLQDLNAVLKEKIAAGREIVVVGDYNVAHRELDVYDPKKLANESGFLPEERAWFDTFLELGFVDAFRHFHPDEKGAFTWWSYVERARPVNRGWRIDYICVTKGLVPALRRAEILDEVEGSDHCPVMAEFDMAVLK